MRTLSRLLFLCLLAVPRPLAAAGPELEPSGSLGGVVRTSDGLALPGVAVVVQGSASERRVTTGPDGSFRMALAAGSYTLAVDAPGLTLQAPGAVSVGAGETRQDLVLAPAPVKERVVVSATRGEATLSSVGVSADVLDRERIEDRARRVAAAVAAGRAGRRDRAQRADRPAGLGLRARRRVALRARDDRRRRRSTSRAGPTTSAARCRSSSSASRSCAAPRAASTAATRSPAS